MIAGIVERDATYKVEIRCHNGEVIEREVKVRVPAPSALEFTRRLNRAVWGLDGSANFSSISGYYLTALPE